MSSKGNIFVSTGEKPPIPIPIHTIHTIHTYIHTYQRDHEGKIPTYNEFVGWVHSQRKKHVTTTFPPLLWDTFRECVNKREHVDVKANHLLERYMKKYIRESFIHFNNQVQLTQFFINKPQQVNIAKKIVVKKPKRKKRIDYSAYTMQELEDAYLRGKQQEDVPFGIYIELKERGINLRQLRRKLKI